MQEEEAMRLLGALGFGGEAARSWAVSVNHRTSNSKKANQSNAKETKAHQNIRFVTTTTGFTRAYPCGLQRRRGVAQLASSASCARTAPCGSAPWCDLTHAEWYTPLYSVGVYTLNAHRG